MIGILLSGCSFVSDGLFPTLTGENPTAKQNIKTNIPPARAESNAQPTLSLPPPARQQILFRRKTKEQPPEHM